MDSNLPSQQPQPGIPVPQSVQEPTQKTPPKGNKFKFILIALALIILIIVGVGGYYSGTREKSEQLITNTLTPTVKPSITSTPAISVAPSITASETPQLLKYSSPNAKISFSYPKDWTISEQFQGETNNFIDIKSSSISVRIEYGDIEGRGGPCVKRLVTYQANIVNQQLNLTKVSDVSDQLSSDYCGGEILKGYGLFTSNFNYNNLGYFIYSIDSENTENTEKAIKAYGEIVSSIKFN